MAHHHDKYWLAFDDAQLERHARLRARAQEPGEPFALQAEVDAFRSVCEIAISTADHAGLFSQLAGAIAACGGSIVEAKAFTANDGLALDVFSVQDEEGGAFGDAGQIARLHRFIGRTLRENVLPKAPATRRIGAHRAAAFEVRPRVKFDNDASAVATVIEVEGADRPGLLFEISRAIFEQELSISSAIAATYGERVMDVFYVHEASGEKVVRPDRLASIESRLLQALSSAT